MISEVFAFPSMAMYVVKRSGKKQDLELGTVIEKDSRVAMTPKYAVRHGEDALLFTSTSVKKFFGVKR